MPVTPIADLKAIVLVTDYNNSIVVNELSGSEQFVEDIKYFNGCAEDLFHDLELPKEKGFYEFNGEVDFGIDENGNVDESMYTGEFTKIDNYTFPQK